MEDFASPLILTKLSPSAARPNVIPRGHLLARLEPEAQYKLVLVSAPAGYGKSTLLAEWARALEQRGVAVAWYALDAGDNAPSAFGAYLLATLQRAIGPLGDLKDLARRMRASPEIDLAAVVPAVINAVASSGHKCALILDDYHLIDARSIHDVVGLLMERLPANLRIAIGSRTDPPLPLARWRARGQLRELRAADLRFTSEETARFLNDVMRLELLGPMVEELETRTEGWAAGLQLAALSLGRQGERIAAFGGGHRYLADYLLEEVVNRLDAETQSFLLSTAVLERLSAPLCDAVCERAGSAALLAELERSNLFLITLDDEARWYRYHHLFRDFLLARLGRVEPERVSRLHRLASEWHAAQGFLSEAVRHAFQTQDWDYAADVVERLSFPMMMRSEIAAIYEWCARFPERVMRRHPLLMIQESWSLVLSARGQNRSRVEARLRQVEKAAQALDQETARALREHADTVATYLSMIPDPAVDGRAQLDRAHERLVTYVEDDAAQFSAQLAVSYAQLALQHAADAEQSLTRARQLALSEPLPYGIVETTFELALLRLSQGRLRAARELCEDGQAQMAALLAGAEHVMPALGCLDVALGRALMEADRLVEAEERLSRGLEMMGWGATPYAQAVAWLAFYRLRIAQGRAAEGIGKLERLDQAWPDVAFCTQGLRAAHALRAAPEDRRALRAASAWADSFAPVVAEAIRPFGMGPAGAAELHYLASLTWAEVQTTIGLPGAARPYLAQQLALAEANGLASRVVELSLLQALAATRDGDTGQKWAALERALRVGQEAGLRRVFDGGPAVARLLSAAEQRGICGDYARSLLVMAGTNASATATAISPSGERLSERELEVLRLMAQGASNGEIAAHLIITVGTVKSHINHILGKLAAGNRTEAVARAREVGLL
jgi:LuxR family transcriptional regulator, maltose regulon positive regulatory protein